MSKKVLLTASSNVTLAELSELALLSSVARTFEKQAIKDVEETQPVFIRNATNKAEPSPTVHVPRSGTVVGPKDY